MTVKQASRINFMMMVALGVILVGFIGSLYLMFNAGRNQKSIFLIACFTTWVSSPFAALMVAQFISKSWSASIRRALFLLTLLITIGSLISYSGGLSIFQSKPSAFKFLIVPLVSWLLIVTIMVINRKTKTKSL